MIRNSKKLYSHNISNKLKTSIITLKNWRSTLKSSTSSLSNSYIPSLEYEGCTYTEDQAYVLYSFFRDQTLLDNYNSDVPEVPLLVSEEKHTVIT